MNCTEARDVAIEHARSGTPATDPHFNTCDDCARFFKTQVEFQAHFTKLASDVPEAPEFRLVKTARPRPVTKWLVASAVAASLAVAAFVIQRHPSTQPSAATEPFVQIPYTAPLAPYERTSIVRMNVPVAALISAGFEMHSSDTGKTLKAEVLFGQDGRARAVRLLTN